ncbi:uncharacterized aarF domain-containing protein kinase 5 [Lepeophtheirus salmonis]|nr:uncharacterized aarF domain-containing protein kinase 5-like [Lepeophtheirus salmonis]
MTPLLLVRKGLKFLTLGSTLALTGTTGVWYGLIAEERQKECLHEALYELPKIVMGGGGLRFLRSAKTGLLVALNYKFELVDADGKSAHEILKTCLSNGGLYVKVGQGLATMNHVLPESFTTPLKVLQDQCLKGGQGDVDLVLQEDLGKSKEDLFSSFESEPMAAASLAQVFKATTTEGRKVAVKVQYPDLQRRFHSDIPTIKSILYLAEIIHPQLRPFQKLFSEIVENLTAELDFLKEGKNAERSSKDLKHLPWVYVPEILWSHSSKRILTMEYIDGIKISDGDALTKQGFDLKSLGSDLIKTFAEQICKSGFVHADPHPGNILVRKGKKTNHEIVILDHGLYEHVPDHIRMPLCAAWKAIVECNHSEMKKNSVKLGVDERDYRFFCMTLSQHYISPQDKNDPNDFLTQFMEKNKGKFSRKDFNDLPPEEKEKMHEAIREVHERVLNTFQKIPKNLVLIFRNLNTIRSIIKDHDSGVERYRIIAKVASRGMFVHPNAGIIDYVRGTWSQLVFDYRLFVDGIWTWIIKKSLGVWLYMGYNPIL